MTKGTKGAKNPTLKKKYSKSKTSSDNSDFQIKKAEEYMKKINDLLKTH